MARSVARGRTQVSYFDLEKEQDLSRLSEPGLALQGLRGLVVLDETQNAADHERDCSHTERTPAGEAFLQRRAG